MFNSIQSDMQKCNIFYVSIVISDRYLFFFILDMDNIYLHSNFCAVQHFNINFAVCTSFYAEQDFLPHIH